jgi:peroxiredoxin
MIEFGQPAPDFELPNQNGEPIRLSDSAASESFSYFYPKADTHDYRIRTKKEVGARVTCSEARMVLEEDQEGKTSPGTCATH